MEKMAAFYKKS